QKTGKITGTVYESETNKTIPDVEIIISALSIGTVTDANGKFVLENISPGNYTIIFSHIGYVKQSKKIKLEKNQTLKLTIFLVQKVQKLNEFIIKDEFINNTPYKIDHIDIINIRESAVSDIGVYLRSTPNVSAIRKGGTNIDPVIRGFKFSQINVLINNGIKIEGGCPNRMDPASSHIDINDISEIKIFKGPYALRYGPNLGGVVNIKTLQPKPYPEFQTKITAIQGFESNWNGSKQHLNIEGGNKLIYFNLSGNYKKYGNYTAGNSEIISSEFEKYNYSVQLGVSPLNNHNFIFSYDRSFGRNVMFPALPMDEITDDTRIMSFDYSAKQISNKINSINFTAYLSEVDHMMDNKNRPFSDTVVAVSAINAINYGYRAEIEINFGNDNLFIGTDNENIFKDGDRTKSLILEPYLPVKIEKLWDNAKIRNFGVFAEYKTTLSIINLMAALRLDFNDASCDKMELKSMKGQVIYSNPDVNSNFINFSFSAGAIYDFSSNTTISLALGHSVRNPDMVERFIILLPIGYDNFDYLGNPQLKPEVNNEIDISLKYQPSKTGIFNVVVFYSYVTNFITGKEVPPSVVKPQSKGVV
ncbi:MAG: TonB-dependent receptor, partial [Bacteroidales bacterium]|nr:TonB-dependent receptor [Bacteroidales bacterium]